MASGIFALLDDITMLADDVAAASKIATQKTAGILGDDLAVNSEKATGFDQNRELKVLWAITKGSLKNKVIILPMAFLLSFFIPWIIPYILILGGLYLLYEGVEKIEEYFHKKHFYTPDEKVLKASSENILDIEKDKIKAAIFTDLILSIEIIMIALGTVLDEPLAIQILATTFVAIVATFGVYGLVAMIVRIDNVGFWLIDRRHVKSGNFLVSLMPQIIKVLSIIGTIAMILVGGGILSHNVKIIHHYFLGFLPTILNEFLVGIIFGIIVLVIVKIFSKLKFSVQR
jgi:predicted DNA repair protein MutK